PGQPPPPETSRSFACRPSLVLEAAPPESAAVGSCRLYFGHTLCQGKCVSGNGNSRPVPNREPLFLVAAPWPEIEIRRRDVGKLPLDVGLLLELVVRVGRFDGRGEGLLEPRKVLGRDRLLERFPVLGEVLVDGRLVLRPHEGAHLEQADDLLVLELRHGPV